MSTPVTAQCLRLGSLSCLPPELRAQIWSIALSDTRITFGDPSESSAERTIPLLHCSKSLRTELLSVIARSVIITVKTPSSLRKLVSKDADDARNNRGALVPQHIKVNLLSTVVHVPSEDHPPAQRWRVQAIEDELNAWIAPLSLFSSKGGRRTIVLDFRLKPEALDPGPLPQFLRAFTQRVVGVCWIKTKGRCMNVVEGPAELTRFLRSTLGAFAGSAPQPLATRV